MPLFPRSTERQSLPTLCIDVSNTIEAPSVSGVQRVTLGLIRGLDDLVPVTLLDGRSGELRPPLPHDMRRLDRLARGAHGRSLTDRLLSRAVRTGLDPRPPFGLDSGAVLIDIEASWHAPQARAELLPQLGATPTAALIHDVLPITNPEWFPPRSIERFSSWFSAHVDAGSTLLAVSEATAAAVATVAPVASKPAVVRLGGPPGLPRSTGSGILMLGTIEPRKGHDLLLDALDLLGDDAPVVDVVGRRGWAADDLVDRLAAHPSIRWHRDAGDDALEELWSLTGLLVQPSRGEGYGLPVAEALQRGGVAVAASDIDAVREAGRGQATHLPLDPGAWADVLARFADDPDAWPRPDQLEWPTWADAATDVVGALVAAGAWPDAPAGSR